MHSGVASEAQAEKLLCHVDSCARCQHVLDNISDDAGLLKRAAKAEKLSKPKVLPDLIQKAQALGRKPNAESDVQQRKNVPFDSFVGGLRKSGLFQDGEVDSVLSDVNESDSGSLAKQLVARGKLTQFQAQKLLKGRWRGLVFGNYVLLDKLGQGGMGSVFVAEHRRLNRKVCIKVISSAGRRSPAMMERFRTEAQAIASLNHPNFIVAHDADEVEGVPFIAMEFLEGADLARHVHQNGPLDLPFALSIVRQAAEAMQYAHDRGVTHRDIKPHNIMLSLDEDSGESTVKLLDLGLARIDSVLNEDPDASLRAAMTNTGVIMGTVDYMAPEQAIRSRDADGKSDIYSLGCTLHYLVTGTPVYEADTVMGRLVAHREQSIPSLAQRIGVKSPHLDAVFQRMIAKDPADRYQSMNEVIADITALQNKKKPQNAPPVIASSESVMDRLNARRKPKANRAVFWGAIAGVICCSIALGMQLLSEKTPDEGVVTAEVEEDEKAPTPSSFVALGNDSSQFFNWLDLKDPELLRNDGQGVALVVAPSVGANQKQLSAVHTAIQNMGLKYHLATEKPGQMTIDDQQVETSYIGDFKTRGFDFVALIDDPKAHFNKDTHASENLGMLLRTAVPQGCVICAFGGRPYDAMESVLPGCVQQRATNGISRFHPQDASGAVFTADCSGDSETRAKLAAKIISTAMLHRKEVLRREAWDISSYDRLRSDSLRRLGGEGRALVVLPMNGFDADELHWLKKQLLHHRNMELVFTSSTWGTPQASHGKYESPGTMIMLEDVRPAEFDFLVFVGGNLKEFEENDGFRSELTGVVSTALDEGVVISAMSSKAARFFELTNLELKCQSLEHGIKSDVTRIAYVDVPQNAGHLADHMVELRNSVLWPSEDGGSDAK